MSNPAKAAIVILMAACIAPPAGAFINPDFTPVHLCRQSDAILVVGFSPADANGHAVAKVTKALKGEADGAQVAFNFSASAFPAKGDRIMKMIAGEQPWGLLFIGHFESDTGMPDSDDEQLLGKALLHLGKDWITLSSYEAGLWDMDDIDARLLGTWAGSTEMLRRAVEYVQANEDADFPVVSGVEWAEKVALATVPGAIASVRAADLHGGGKCVVHVASNKGDQLLRLSDDGKSAENIAAARGLKSASLVATWCDADRNGRTDLASWDGKELKLWMQADDGTFIATPPLAGDALSAGVVSLAGLDCGEKGRFLVAGTTAGPVLVLLDGQGGKPLALPAATSRPDDADAKQDKNPLGLTGDCRVADFDGDAIPDVLNLGQAGALFYKGAGGGQFADPAKMDLPMGKGRHAATVGDFDMNGLLDILTCSAEGNLLYNNSGGGKFREMLAMSGEIEYIAKRNGIDAMTGDVSNDGRQDVAILYANTPPQVFFNRGFNSFGHARMLDVVETDVLVESAGGQQAGCLVDLNRDGALDWIIALDDGSVVMLPRKTDRGALAAVATIKPGKGFAGPITVVGRQEGRCFGAYSISAGGSGALFGLHEPGPVSLEWTTPDGKKHTEDVFVDEGRVTVVLNK